MKGVSGTGAWLQVAVPVVVPDYFELECEGIRMKCHVRWRVDGEIGVEFFNGTGAYEIAS